jgi:hypothetical protein
MAELATCGKVTYKLKSPAIDLTFEQQPNLTPIQRRAYELLGLLPVIGK